MCKHFYIEDEDKIPAELSEAAKDKSKKIQVETIIGWITIENSEFTCMNKYRVVDA